MKWDGYIYVDERCLLLISIAAVTWHISASLLGMKAFDIESVLSPTLWMFSYALLLYFYLKDSAFPLVEWTTFWGVINNFELGE